MSDYERFKKIAGILKDTNAKEYTRDDFEYLSSVGFLNKFQTETIRSREDVFELILNNEIQNSTRKLMTSLKSPYHTDKDLGLDLEDGLSSVFPVNSRCATFEIQGENSVGYLSVNPNGSMVEIFKSGGVIEEFTVSESNSESMLKSVARNFEFLEDDIEKVIKNKTLKEYDEVFYSKTGYQSLADFIQVKMPELANKLTNTYEVLDNIHSSGLNGVVKFSEGSITAENLINVSIVSQIYEKLKDGTQFSEKEKSAYLDQMSYEDRFGFASSIEELNTVNTEYLCKFSCYGVDRLSTTNNKVAVFKLEDGTAIVSVDGGFKEYKPDELLEEYDSIYNTPELFTMLDMYYLGECKIEIQLKQKEEPEVEVELPVAKKKTTHKPR